MIIAIQFSPQVPWFVIISLPLKNIPILQARVVQRMDNAIHRINHYPADSVLCFVNTYPLDSVIQPLNNRGLKFYFHQMQDPLVTSYYHKDYILLTSDVECSMNINLFILSIFLLWILLIELF